MSVMYCIKIHRVCRKSNFVSATHSSISNLNKKNFMAQSPLLLVSSCSGKENRNIAVPYQRPFLYCSKHKTDENDCHCIEIIKDNFETFFSFRASENIKLCYEDRDKNGKNIFNEIHWFFSLGKTSVTVVRNVVFYELDQPE